MPLPLLRDQLKTYFNKSELHDLCYDLGINYQAISGDTIDDLARELVEYCRRHGLLTKLIERCRQLRPHVDWQNADTVKTPSLIERIDSTSPKHTSISARRDAIVAGRDIYLSADDGRARAERKTDEGRQKVQQWGERISQSGWDEQAWHLLGFALQLTHEAVEIDSDYQRAWTLMADIYHRIGKEELARKCLKKSYSLATPGPNHPGRFYRDVERNIRSGYPFNSAGGLTRQSLPEWFEAKYQRYWTL